MTAPAAASEATLEILETAGLVTLERTEPELEYAFRHALVQDAAYDSILRRERAELHRAVAVALERLYPQHLDELAAELVRHYEAAGDLPGASEWAFRAARHAERRSAMPEARALYDRAAAWLPDGPAAPRRRAEIALGQSRAGLYFGSFEEEITRLEGVIPEAETVGDARLLVELYHALAFALQLRGEQYEGSPRLQKAIDRGVALGQSLGDDPIRARPLMALGLARMFAGRFREAVDLLQEAGPLFEASGDLLWAFESKANLLMSLVRLGRFEDAESVLAGALDAAVRSGSPSAAVDVQVGLAILRSARGQVEEALAAATRAVEEGEAKRILVCAAFGHLVVGQIGLERGEYASAIRSLQRSSRLAHLTRAHFIENLGRAALNTARWETGEQSAARDGWATALESARSEADRYGEGEVLAHRGAALAAGAPEDLESAIADLEAGAAIFEELGTRPALARAHLALAGAYRRAGRPAEASNADRAARALFGELGLRPAR